MLDLVGKPVLQHVVERCKKSDVDEVIVATTVEKQDDEIVSFCEEKSYKYFRGSEEDVLDRYYKCAKKFELGNIIRVTSDCPLVDKNIINKLIKIFKDANYDYISNIFPIRKFPRGYDVEMLSFETLKLIDSKATKKINREHVTRYIHKNASNFKIYSLNNDEDYSEYRLTLDEHKDFELLNKIFKELYSKDNFFDLNQVVKFLEKNTFLKKINERVNQK